jgi:hypothetical protein
MSRVRSFVGVAMLVLALAALAGIPASAKPSQVACGDVIAADTVLTKNLTCAGDGLTVTNGATLDLRGHSLRGDGTGVGIRLARPGASMVVTHGTISGFGTGVDVGASSVRLEDLEIKNNAQFGVFVSDFRAEQDVVQHNKITGNGTGVGFANGAGLGSQLLDNTIKDNAGDGIRATNQNDGITYQRNDVSKNGGYGMRISSSISKILGNRLNENALDGLLADEDLESSKPAWLIADNRADHNGGHGLDVATPGIPDGGGNRAKGNDLSPQCVNLAC